MKKTFMPSLKTKDELLQCQLEGFKWTVRHAYRGSPFYRQRLDDAGVGPDSISSLNDLQRLPFTSVQDLRDGYPFPLLSVPMQEVVRMHASSGTTGKRKIMVYTRKDIEDWTHFFARCYEMAGCTVEDRIQISSGYGIWTAGVSFQAACEEFGAMAIPIGPGNIDMQCQFMIDFGTTVMTCTASMALLLAEEVNKRGIRDRLKLTKLILGSEPSSDAMRERVKELLGIEHLFDIPGMTELYGPGTGLDCVYHDGIHYWADYYILEILDPETLKPVQDGEIGEMVVTTLRKEAAPLIRYRTRDLTRLVPGDCRCGCPLPRHERLLGRSDDMVVYRAVNIYPGQIDYILSNTNGLGSEFQLHFDRKADGKDYMTVKVERTQGGDPALDARLAASVEAEIKKQVLASGKVEIVDHGTLGRSERKTKRVFDNREF